MTANRFFSAGISASLGMGAGATEASIFQATLVEVRTFTNNSTSGTAGNITSSTATWTYDDITKRLSQAGGTYVFRATTSPMTTLYRTSITGLVLGNGSAASAATFVCIEGNFGGGVGASLCGNYNFGANFANESTTTWGPGAATSRTLGGDDESSGPPQGTVTFDGFATSNFSSTLVLTNATCTGTCMTLPAGAFNNGQRWTLNAARTTPGATEDAVAVGTGVPIDIDVFANDYHSADDYYLYIEVPPDGGGSAVVVGTGFGGSGGRIRYTSAPGFSGVETFTYRASVPAYWQDTALVTVEVVDAVSNPDADGDGVADRVDNCSQRANSSQCDSDSDGYGNRCDGDLDNNNATNATDSVSLRFRLGTTSSEPQYWFYMGADINCNGVINAQDVSLFRQLLGSPPGPSSRAP